MYGALKTIAKSGIKSLASRLGGQALPALKPKIWVLMYHRILPASDPRYSLEEPGMVVTPESFRAHIRWLRDYFAIVSLSEWLEKQRSNGSLPNKCVAVTFDDGWRDNYEFAFPILKETNTPATIFVVSGMIGTNQQFWPNRVGRLLLEYESELVDLECAAWLHSVLAKQSTNTDARDKVAAVIDSVKNLDDQEIEQRLHKIEAALQVPAPQQPAMMDWRHLKEIQNTGLVEIGGHTMSHRRLLPHLDEATLEREIVTSKQQLEARLGNPVNLFCYPNGDYSAAAHALVQANYTAAVTTQKGINSKNVPHHELKRIGVHEDVALDRLSFLHRLSGWY